MAVAATPQIAHRGTGTSGYERRRPEQTALYRLLDTHWPTFLERSEEAGGLPAFVVREVEEYLRCGILEHGLLRLGCQRCGHERLVAFSCKRRGFCPSCLGRRMTDTAVHLSERVLPEVPLRQWVCSLPWDLRCLLGYDRALCASVLGIFVEELMRSYRWRAKQELGLGSVHDAHPGAVTFVQRFDSALRLNVHFHTLAPDGVYVRDAQGELIFEPLPEPTADEVAEVARRTAERVRRLLERRGREPGHAFDEHEHPALGSCYAAAAQGLSLFGDRAGQPPLRLVDPDRTRDGEPVAEVKGFNVHAKVAIDGRDKKRVERLCRYLARPPIAQDRLTELTDGRLQYVMKKAWRDGTHALVFEPLDLIARICAMIPPPRFHMVRFHGVLSSHASLRAEVVPTPPAETGPLDPLQLQQHLFPDDEPPRRKPWAWLLRHVFDHDVLRCERCGGPTTWLEVATTPEQIARALVRHGLAPPQPPPPKGRAPPHPGQLSLAFAP